MVNNHTLKIDQARLAWACRRGMLELDVILNQFLNKTYPTLSDNQKHAFQALLGCNDMELFAWLIRDVTDEAIDENHRDIVNLIKRHARPII